MNCLDLGRKSDEKEMRLPWTATCVSTDDNVDLYGLLFAYVTKHQCQGMLKKRVNFEKLSAKDVIETNFRMTHKPAQHSRTNLTSDQSPKTASIVFSSNFVNNTSEVQTNNLRTERRTNTNCRIFLTKTLTKGGELSLKIAPPGTEVEVGGGVSKEITMTNEREITVEEEMIWSIDSQVTVPPHSRMKADLVITEDKYEGSFLVETIIEGQIAVALRDKRSGELLSVAVITNFPEVFTEKQRFRKIPGSPNAVAFVSEGRCTASFAIDQEVKLKEEKI